MFNLGQSIFDLLSPLGPAGLLVCVFALFYIDAIVFPTVPELFAVIIFIANPTLWFAGAMLGTIAVAEILGLTTLYMVVKRWQPPQVICRAIRKYRDFLFVKDEKAILVNRIAPILPFIGAFVAINNWSYRRSIYYTIVGGMVKYGVILAISGWFFTFMNQGDAANFTFLMIVIVLAISFIVSAYRRRRVRRVHEDRPA
jgi:hypothetical protein